MVRQAQAASLEVGVARGVHSDYRQTVEEMVGAGVELGRALEMRAEGLVREVEVAFPKVVERKKESMIVLKVVKKKDEESGEWKVFLKVVEGEKEVFLKVVEQKEALTESEIFLKVVEKEENLGENELKEIELVFNLEDEGFGEGKENV